MALAVDLFCGLGGWTEGLLAEGWKCRGYDIEAHEYGDEKYPGELILADVIALTGADVADADLIVASPPCTEFSYMAMPWGRAKQIARALRGVDEFPEGYKGSRTIAELTALFDACFRIQREANAIRAARGQPPVPMVVENVRGAIPWLGPAAWNYGSYYLWGDVPALMPGAVDARKVPGFRFDGSGRSFQTAAVADTFGWSKDSPLRSNSSKSPARKAASAKIAKIPFTLSQHIARTYFPTTPANDTQPKESAA